MEEWLAQLPRLEARSHFNVSLNTSTVSEPSWTSTNSTRAVIASLQLAQVQTLRTMHLALGVFSLALALLTVLRILSDARRAAELQVTLRKQRFNSLRNVHSAETFPLVLACGAVSSQIIFVAVQGTTLNSVLSESCRMIAMVTFPTIFAMGYITLAFGIDTALRSFKQDRFAPRGKWNTILCITAVHVLLLATWIPTIVWPMFNKCFGGLIWFIMRYDLLTLVLLIVLVSLLLLLAAIISIQLVRTADVDLNERIAASRMVYYLLMTAAIYTLVIPVEVQSLQENFDAALGGARFAEASLFSSGIVISFFHLFLRTNANRLIIRPIDEMRSQSEQKRPRLRLFGPSDLEMNISGPMALVGGRRPDSRQGLIDVGPEKNRFDFDPEYFERPERAMTPGSKLQSPIDLTKWPLPPDLDESKEETKGHQRNKASYSIFPTRAEDVPRFPATVYNPSRAVKGESRISKLAMRRFNRRSSVTDVSREFESMDKPNPFFAVDRTRHASTASCATVQIGLRFSLGPAMLSAAKYTSPTAPNMPKLNRNETDSSTETLGLPLQATSPTAKPDEVLQPAVFSPPAQRALSPAKPSPARTPAFPLTPSQNSSAYLQAQREKVLIPTPGTPPSLAPSPLPANILSGLRMNPVTPSGSVAATSPTTTSPRTSEPATSSRPSTPLAAALLRSNSGKSAKSPSPTARIPLGQGTMSRSPPPRGWV